MGLGRLVVTAVKVEGRAKAEVLPFSTGHRYRFRPAFAPTRCPDYRAATLSLGVGKTALTVAWRAHLTDESRRLLPQRRLLDIRGELEPLEKALRFIREGLLLGLAAAGRDQDPVAATARLAEEFYDDIAPVYRAGVEGSEAAKLAATASAFADRARRVAPVLGELSELLGALGAHADEIQRSAELLSALAVGEEALGDVTALFDQARLLGMREKARAEEMRRLIAGVAEQAERALEAANGEQSAP